MSLSVFAYKGIIWVFNSESENSLVKKFRTNIRYRCFVDVSKFLSHQDFDINSRC